MRRIRFKIGIFGLLLALWTIFAWAAARALVVGDRPAPADAIAVLAGSSAYRERTELAAKLFREGYAPLVILTDDGQRGGWSTVDQRNLSFVERAARELKSREVPPEKIRIVPMAVSGTYEEAAALRDFARREKLRSLLVVTSAYHSRRARWALRKAFAGSGIEVKLVAVERPDPSPWLWWITSRGWRNVAAEYAKFAYYFSRFR